MTPISHPELMAELDAIKRDRIGSLMLRRDWGGTGTVADMALGLTCPTLPT